MKVFQISTSDISGGAARAAYRLHKSLRALGVDTNMFVQEKLGDDHDIIGPMGKVEKGLSNIRPTLDLLPLYLVGKADKPISSAWLPDQLRKRLSIMNKDVIHLHWINKGFIQVDFIRKLSTPVVWTLHDMWPFTGGCHYDLDCGRYIDQCGVCPQLGSSKELDISRWIWWRKAHAWSNVDLTIVSPSRWMADCASKSSLFAKRRIKVIAYGVDLTRFRPINQSKAREWLGLPRNKKLVLYSAVKGVNNPYKGFKYIEPILEHLSNMGWKEQIELVVMGSSQLEGSQDLSLPSHYLGHLHDEISLAMVYGAVDLLLAPSIQDNLPITIMEAIACGTPCIAFEVGGMSDLIDHQGNGYLVEKFDVQEFSYGIDWILRNEERYTRLAQMARMKAVREFNLIDQAKQYIRLYKEVIEIPNP